MNDEQPHDLIDLIRRSVDHIRETIESMELTIDACRDRHPDGAAYWQAKVDDLSALIAVLERS